MIFNQENVSNLILAVHDFYQKPNVECRSSYAGLALPQMKEKILEQLTIVLENSLKNTYTNKDQDIFIPIIAQMIHEGALQIANNNMEQEVLANKIALFIIGRY